VREGAFIRLRAEGIEFTRLINKISRVKWIERTQDVIVLDFKKIIVSYG